MKKGLIWGAAVVTIAAIGYFTFRLTREEVPEPGPIAEVETPVEAPAPPSGPRFPVEPTPVESPLPALDDSDAALGNALAGLLGLQSLPAYIYPDKMIRRFVATIDNLPRRRTPALLMPVAPIAGNFLVTEADSEITIDPANSKRYVGYVDVMESVDVPRLVDVYVRFYPLFQQAYLELGYPKGYFNDRLVEALEDMLDAPQVPASARLVRPNVFYLFSDPDLEARSAGQKIIVRVGEVNGERIKAVLRAIRHELVSRAPVSRVE